MPWERDGCKEVRGEGEGVHVMMGERECWMRITSDINTRLA